MAVPILIFIHGPLAGKRIDLADDEHTVGRGDKNDIIVNDPLASRVHAIFMRRGGVFLLEDLGSHNGTYVNGRRISSQMLTEHDLVSIGHSTFRLKDGELRQFVDDGEISFSAHDLVVKVAGGKILLDHVTFAIPEKCLLGIIGPSGAGKSTLLGAL
ncbi:MAG TPA: FHA domain-containing protein, partial [Mycobacteriales bacterium]|nr:FHA domain-containing protein [Mycobacteriales bacterium]